MKTGILYGIVEKTKTLVECMFCMVCIPKAKRCIEQHAHGAKHKEHLAMMEENGVRFTNKKLHCKLCKRDFERGETVSKHVTREDHASWMVALTDLVDGEYIALHEYFTNDDEEILCEVCNCPFDFSLGAIEQHVNWFNHRSSLAENVKSHNGMFPVEDNSELWCKVCNAYIANNVQSVLHHVDDDRVHVGWVWDMEDYTQEDGIDFKEYLSTEHKLTAVCRYCHVDVMCDIFSIEEHIMGNLHITNIPAPDET